MCLYMWHHYKAWNIKGYLKTWLNNFSKPVAPLFTDEKSLDNSHNFFSTTNMFVCMYVDAICMEFWGTTSVDPEQANKRGGEILQNQYLLGNCGWLPVMSACLWTTTWKIRLLVSHFPPTCAFHVPSKSVLDGSSNLQNWYRGRSRSPTAWANAHSHYIGSHLKFPMIAL